MRQLSLFMDETSRPYKIKTPIRLIELFAGVGSQAMALRDIGAEFEHWRVVEFDKYAIKSYNAIHGTDFPVTDIRDIHGADLGITDKERFTYLLTYSFPCTDLSVAGKMAGMQEGSGTRSSLLWEVKRLLTETDELPQVLMMENVPQVHSKKNLEEWERWLEFLRNIGYTTWWKDINAKDYGVAQSRNRTIAISILGNYSFSFPEPFPLNKTMKDYLEDRVDEKYYITNDKARKLIDQLIVSGKIPLDGKQGVDLCHQQAKTADMANSIAARYDAGIVKHKNEHTGVVECTKIFGGGKSALASQPIALSQSQQQTASLQEQTEESAADATREAESLKYPSYLNYSRVDAVDVNIARTLMARDSKGFGTGTETSNGVSEIEIR